MEGKRILWYLIPSAIILLFLFIMLWPAIFKGEYIPQQLAALSADVRDENWGAAKEKIESLDTEWQKVSKIIQFGAEREKIDRLSAGIARLKVMIENGDKNMALTELAELSIYWLSLGE